MNNKKIAKAWMDKEDFWKIISEYDQLQKLLINIDKDCRKWKANPKLNQSDDYPALDSTLFKCNGEIFKPNCDKEYVNISRVEVPLKRNVNIGQIPMKGSEETFWKAFFELHVTFMTILNEDSASIEFFPQRVNDSVHYGTMIVNNRRVENISEDVVRFLIEVLPSGCSNSHIATITVVKNWKLDSVHAKHAVVMKEIVEMSTWMATAPAEENAMIMSKHGAGRAGYFVALAVAVHKMDQKSEPNMFEIVKSIRLQRPKAVETVTQYASLYEATFEKIAQLEEKKEKAEARIGALETVMAEQRAEVEELRKMMAELKATMGKRAAPEALFLRAFAEEMAQSGNFGEATATGDGVKYERGGRGNYKWKHLSIRDCFADDWKKIAEAAMKTLSKEERNIFLQNRQPDLLPQIPPSPPIQSTQDDESDVESDISA